MDGFTYINIFETKGIEYIIIIFFMCLLIPFWLFINKPMKVKEQVIKAFSVLTAGVLRIPRGLYFSKNHTWLHLEKSGTAKIGIDDFLLRMVGKIKMNLLKSTGDKVKKGEIMAEIVQDGKLLKLFSPVSGEIIRVNSVISKNSEILTSDPYGEGWIYTIAPLNWKAETSGFFVAEDAVIWIANEIQRVKDFLNVELAKKSETAPLVVYQEGGELHVNPMEGLMPEIWNGFQKEFLNHTD
jgi:glycine cleavage system H protein